MPSPTTGTLYWLGVILGDEDLDATETLLLITLADHVNADDQCFARIERIASGARCSYSTARRRLKGLEEKGYITRYRQRREGRLSVYDYVLVRPDARLLALNLSASDEASSAHPGGHLKSTSSAHPGGRWSSAHPGERTEVPRIEVPQHTHAADAAVLDAEGRTEDDPLYGFANWWKAYPARRGRKVGKAAAEEKWKRLSVEHRREVYRATLRYREEIGEFAKDPQRFITKSFWKEWLTAPEAGAATDNGVATGAPNLRPSEVGLTP